MVDLDQALELAKQLKEVIAALFVGIPLAVKAWNDFREKGRELREKGFASAAEDLYQHGEELKADWKAAGKGKKDLISRLRSMAPGLLMRYGISQGVSEEDIQKLLGLGQSIHKARKVFGSGPAIVVALPEAPLEIEVPEDPPTEPGETA